MQTELELLNIGPEIHRLVGSKDPNNRVYRRRGSYQSAGEWFEALDAQIDGGLVSPGGVAMFVPVSRAAVYKRLQHGQLTAFCFHVTEPAKTFFGTKRRPRTRPFIYVPVSECKAWAQELRRGNDLQESSRKQAGADRHLRQDVPGNRVKNGAIRPAQAAEPGWQSKELEEGKEKWL